jgi:hypothetical protein
MVWNNQNTFQGYIPSLTKSDMNFKVNKSEIRKSASTNTWLKWWLLYFCERNMSLWKKYQNKNIAHKIQIVSNVVLGKW